MPAAAVRELATHTHTTYPCSWDDVSRESENHLAPASEEARSRLPAGAEKSGHATQGAGAATREPRVNAAAALRLVSLSIAATAHNKKGDMPCGQMCLFRVWLTGRLAMVFVMLVRVSAYAVQ